MDGHPKMPDEPNVIPLKPLDVSALPKDDQDFLTEILEKIESHLTPDEYQRLAKIAASLEEPNELSAIALPLERPTLEEPWDYSTLRDAYLELADAYEDLFELPPEEDDDAPPDAAE
jgi:hypothetical protein